MSFSLSCSVILCGYTQPTIKEPPCRCLESSIFLQPSAAPSWKAPLNPLKSNLPQNMATTVVSLPAPHYPAWGSIECQGPHLLLPLTLNSESPETPNTTEHDPLARFPKLLRTSLCWNPASFSNKAPEYIVHLDADEIESIYETVASFKGTKRTTYSSFSHSLTCSSFTLALSLPDIASICPDNFHLPTELATKLRGLSRTVHNGRGFAVLRGLDPQGRADEDNVIAFAGIGSYIGLNRYASSDGKAMGSSALPFPHCCPATFYRLAL